MECLGELVYSELEALQATYSEDELSCRQTCGPTGDKDATVAVHATVQPHTAHDESTKFVELVVVFNLPLDYPEQPPGISIRDCKGVGDARAAQLLGLLKAEAAGLLGELVLGHLIEVAKEWATQHNHPEGHCIFCLESMEGGTVQLVKLPCFHTFHR